MNNPYPTDAELAIEDRADTAVAQTLHNARLLMRALDKVRELVENPELWPIGSPFVGYDLEDLAPPLTLVSGRVLEQRAMDREVV